MPPPDQALLDELSEMLAVGRDGERLYARLVDDAPAHVSPGAETVHRMTDAVVASTEAATARRWMYRALHILSYETRDAMVWRALDALGEDRGGETGEVLKTAATAVLSREALGARGADRSEERVSWLLEAMEVSLAAELGVSADKAGPRRGIRRLR